MRRLLSLVALLGLSVLAGCCHNTCDTCDKNHCPGCTQATSHMAPAGAAAAPCH